MAQEDVDLVRALFEGASTSKDAIMIALPGIVAQAFDPEVEWVEAPERADGRTWRGHEGIVDSFRRWLEEWEEYRVELDRTEDHGGQVFVAAREHGRGATSGASTTSRIFAVLWFRDGRIVRYEEFYDEAAARARLASNVRQRSQDV